MSIVGGLHRLLAALALGMGVGACSTSCADSDSTTPAAQRVETAPVPRLEHVVFPLRIAAQRLYLVDASGRPFLVHGDAAWSLIAGLRREDVERYLDDRRTRGFNAILVNLLEHRFSRNAPANAYGVHPFRVANDYGTPDDRYFAHADWVLEQARNRGFLVLLTPSYLGYNGGDEGWYQAMRANGPARLRAYGRYLGRRYAAFDNVLWVHGGDYDPPDKSLVREIAEGIREHHTSALNSAHCAPERTARDCWGGEAWLQVDNVYTYGPVAPVALAQHANPVKMPYILIEGRYENDCVETRGESGRSCNERRIRAQAYQALLSGAAGHVFGNNPIWHFDGPGLSPAPTSWQKALGSRGALSMSHLRSLFVARPWWTLEPDTGNSTLTAGHGSGHDRAVSAIAADRSFAVVYMPTKRTVTVALDTLAGPRVAARWYDPAEGTLHTMHGSPFTAKGARDFLPPRRNTSGFDDWILLLESTT